MNNYQMFVTIATICLCVLMCVDLYYTRFVNVKSGFSPVVQSKRDGKKKSCLLLLKASDKNYFLIDLMPTGWIGLVVGVANHVT